MFFLLNQDVNNINTRSLDVFIAAGINGKYKYF